MDRLWNREGDKKIGICVKSSYYGKIGDMAPLTEVIYSEKTWSHVSELIKSGDWRMTNDIEAGAYMAGRNTMLDAFELVHILKIPQKT